MKARFLILSTFVLLLSGAFATMALRVCHLSMAPMANGKRAFQVHGQVRGLDIANRIVRLAHDEIPGYMPAMTMPLIVKDAALLKGLSAGDEVRVELVVTEDDSWIANIEKVPQLELAGGGANGTSSRHENDTASNEVQAGELVPNFTLTDQNGRPVRLSDYRGKAVVLTFIYTRCPLPNFCPLMSKNFLALQERLRKDLPGQYQLLSVTIDPRFDRPEVLKNYASQWGADEKTWSFATGDEEQIDFVAGLFGLVHEPDNGLISHNLRTALIGKNGRLLHLWKSNVWTPYEVHRMLSGSLSNSRTDSAAK